MSKKRPLTSGASRSPEAVLYSDKPSRIAYWERRNRQKSHQRRRVSDEEYPCAGNWQDNDESEVRRDRNELPERRQFNDSYADLSPEAREIALAIDAYKIHFRRQYINHEELLMVLQSLGYKQEFTP